MADIADIANDAVQATLERNLAGLLGNRSTASRETCIDCEDVIPPERRRLGGKVRCLSCQQDHETRNRSQIRRPAP